MGTTSEYLIPYPELGNAADAPDLAKDIADRVEAIFPNQKLWTKWGPSDTLSGNLNGNTTTVIFSQTVPSVSIGWVDVEFSIHLGTTSFRNFFNSGGTISIKVNDVVVGIQDWDSYNQMIMMTPKVSGRANIVRAQTTVKVECLVTIKAAGSAVSPGQYMVNLRQMGSPR